MDDKKIYTVIFAIVILCAILVVFFIGFLILVLAIKKRSINRSIESEKRFTELTARIDETQRLFKVEVTNILQQFKKIFK